MFRVSSTHLQEDIVVHKQHMVPSLSIRVLLSCWYVCPLKWEGGKRACTLVPGTQDVALRCFSTTAQLIKGFTGLYFTLEHNFKKKALQNQNVWNKIALIPCTHTHYCQQLLFPHCIFVCNENSTVSAKTYQPCKIFTVINTCVNDRLVSYITLTCQSQPVSLRTIRFKIQEFYLVITLPLQVLCGSQNKQHLFL